MDSLTLLLQVHVALSLVGIASGLVALYGLVTGKLFAGWTALFLATTILTSITGFPLPPYGFDPPRAIGVLSLVLLALAVAGLYVFCRQAWRRSHRNRRSALYLNTFVAVVQSFQEALVPAAIGADAVGPSFVIAQLVVLAAFSALGALAVIRFAPRLAAT